VTRAGDILLAAALLTLAGALGWWLGRRPDPRLVAQLETLRTTNLQLDSAVQAYRAAGPSADAVIVHARATAAVHDTVTVRLIDSVILSAPDTLAPILERVRAAHVATVADLNSALDATTARLARADSLLARSEQLRQANLALAAAAVKHSGRGVFVIAVGVGATYSGERVAVGPTVVVGVRVPVGWLMR
jgi:hypothetical protein